MELLIFFILILLLKCIVAMAVSMIRRPITMTGAAAVSLNDT